MKGSQLLKSPSRETRAGRPAEGEGDGAAALELRIDDGPHGSLSRVTTENSSPIASESTRGFAGSVIQSPSTTIL